MNFNVTDSSYLDKSQNEEQNQKHFVDRGISLYTSNKYTQEILKKSEFKTFADIKVLYFISQTGIPSRYEEEIKAIVPNPSAFPIVKKTWTNFRNSVRDIINMDLPRSEMAFLWENSAESIEQLLEHEQLGGEKFLFLAESIIQNSGGKAFFGPNNINLTKSRESIESKIKRSVATSGCTPEYAIKHIDDGIRGTITFKTPKELKKGLEEFIELSKKRGWEIDSSNIWTSEDDYSGYVDVDFRIKIPLDDEKVIMAELQFHLEDFYDGTEQSVVSRAHKIYEIIRMIPTDKGNTTSLDSQDLIETSRLFFTVALFFQSLRA